MAEWIFRREQGCCAWLGRGLGKRSERRSRLKAICPNGMRSFWKVAAFRLTESIRILSVRRALRCFQNELHHFVILNLKWYKLLISNKLNFLQGFSIEISTVQSALFNFLFKCRNLNRTLLFCQATKRFRYLTRLFQRVAPIKVCEISGLATGCAGVLTFTGSI